MTPEEYARYRENRLESGRAYQDFVVDLLIRQLGLAISVYASAAYQTLKGESRQGIEIKHDEKYAESGNLFVEYAEKWEPGAGCYKLAGFMREDQHWLDAIGNYDTVFLFSNKILRSMHADRLRFTYRYQRVANRTRTALGMLVPDRDARAFASLILTPNAERVVAKGSIGTLQTVGRALHRLLLRDPAQPNMFEAS